MCLSLGKKTPEYAAKMLCSKTVADWDISEIDFASENDVEVEI